MKLAQQHNFGWVAILALPLLGYLGSIGLAEWRLWGAPKVDVKIEGYDPRDPLRGHYLIFRISSTPAPLTGLYDACIAQVGKEVVVYLRDVSEEEPAKIDLGARVHRLDAGFVHDSHRYYVQQDQAGDLEKALIAGRLTARLAMLGEGRARVVALLLDGKPLGE